MRSAVALLLTLAGCATTGPVPGADAGGRDLVTAYFDAFNRHDVDAVLALYAPDASMEDPSYPEPVRGLAAIREHLERLFEEIPDVRDEVRSAVVEPGHIAVEFVASGTPRGANTPFRLRIATFFEVVGGRIVRDATYYDRGR